MRNLKTKSVKVTGGIFLVLFLVISSGNMFGQEKGLEMSVTGYANVGDYFSILPGGMLSLAYTLPKGLGTEFGCFVGEYGLLIFNGNFTVAPIRSTPVEPYALIGVGAAGYITYGIGSIFADAGGGIKLHIFKRFALRTEYQRWFPIGYKGSSTGLLRAGISYYF
jgi:hypothetical protein